MKKILIGGLVVILLGGGGIVGYYLLSGNNQEDASTITIATFNIQNLGRDKAYQVPNVVKIIEQFDLVAVQEVMNYDSGRAGAVAVQAIVDSLGENWTSLISEEANGTAVAESTNSIHTFEFYAFIWQKDRIELIENSAHLWDEDANSIAGLNDQERQFDREPFIASFKTAEGNLDFSIINLHAASPSKDWRDDEIKRLKIVYNNVQGSNTNQNDIFLCGDFNTPVNKSEWDSLETLPTMDHILTENDKTTINRNTGELSQNQYDTFWFQANASREDIVQGSGQVLSAWNISMVLDPDLTLPDNITDEDAKKRWYYGKMVSDHLPVILVLRTDKDTDNF